MEKSFATPRAGERQRKADHPVSRESAQHLTTRVMCDDKHRRRNGDILTPCEVFYAHALFILAQSIAVVDLDRRICARARDWIGGEVHGTTFVASRFSATFDSSHSFSIRSRGRSASLLPFFCAATSIHWKRSLNFRLAF